MHAVKALNLAIRLFVVELGALAAAAYWGYEATDGAARWILAVAAPGVVILVWGLFIAPKARLEVSPVAAFAIELALLFAVAAGLAAAGPVWLGIAYGVLALASGVLNFSLRD